MYLSLNGSDNNMTNKKATRYEELGSELTIILRTSKPYKPLMPRGQIIRVLKKRRNQLNMSQEGLAKIVGLKQPNISKIERGTSNIRINTFLRIMRALKLDMDISEKTKTTVEIPYETVNIRI